MDAARRFCSPLSRPERNREIFLRRVVDGERIDALAKEYGLTRARIQVIVDKWRKVEKEKIAAFLAIPTISRPMDMGGPRDVWVESTPETVYRETHGSCRVVACDTPSWETAFHHADDV